ncbi:hypothetical protein [Corynebacterium doosanense]|uniref:hypothetical protein n=1 Tax=Corynebacterium doosanense TaxID=1121358 RepID=UPI000364BAD0|nr:hypothetical protein [Corynebacterium doosanense]
MEQTVIDADDLFVLANQTTQVKAAVSQRSANIASRTRRELAKAKIDADVTVTPRTLANGRSGADVTVSGKGDYSARRAGRILRRTAREVRR